MAIINEKGINANGYYVSTKGITTSGKVVVFKTIKHRDDYRPTPEYAWVIDATADPTVNTGSAFYVYANKTWKKLYETEMMDNPGGQGGTIVLDNNWESIQGKPAASPDSIDSAVQKQHEHSNKELLDKLSAVNGVLFYNNLQIAKNYDVVIAQINNAIQIITRSLSQYESGIANNSSKISDLTNAVSTHENRIANLEQSQGQVPPPVDLSEIENRLTAVESELGLVKDKTQELENIVGV